MISIVGTDTGRIFAGGRDGHIHELVYQVDSTIADRRATNRCSH